MRPLIAISVLILAMANGAPSGESKGKGKAHPDGVSQESFDKRDSRYPNHPGKADDLSDADFLGDEAFPKGQSRNLDDRNQWTNAAVPYLIDENAGFSYVNAFIR